MLAFIVIAKSENVENTMHKMTASRFNQTQCWKLRASGQAGKRG